MPESIADSVTLANGVTMPRLGLGTYKAAEGGDVERAVAEALELGYRGIDTASLYDNEDGVGHALRESGVSRDELFVATKVWNDEQGYAGTRAALERSLTRLGLDHVDLYLVHWPVPELITDTWRAMQEIHASGLARAIGVCNFLAHHLETLAKVATEQPVVNQFEFHPYLQQPELTAYCRRQGIVVQAWAPIMRGRVFEVPELATIGDRHGKSAAQVAIRWILQRGFTAIPKSVHSDRIRENADVFDFELTQFEMSVIDRLDRGERLGPHPDFFPER